MRVRAEIVKMLFRLSLVFISYLHLLKGVKK